MDSCCQSIQEFLPREELRKEALNTETFSEAGDEVRDECPDVSQEELRKDICEQDIENNIRSDAYLRTQDSEAEIDENEEESKVVDNSSNVSQLNQESVRSLNAIETDLKEAIVISSSSTGDSLAKTDGKTKGNQNDERKSKPYVLSSKWGETVNISDSNGQPKRIVNLSEIKNYIPLRIRYNSRFKFYFALVDPRYPQMYRNYASGGQRWRMRYNIFVDGLFEPMKKLDSIVHMGEAMVYFDIGKDMSFPYFINSSFYANYMPLETTVDTSRLTRIIVYLHLILDSSLILQLKFPMSETCFKNTDKLFYKFLMRQRELMDELKFLNHRMKQWSQVSKRFPIDSKRLALDTREYDHHYRPIDRRRREPIAKNKDEEKVKRNDYRVDRRTNTRTYRRSADTKQPLREMTFNSMESKTVERNAIKKSFKKKNRSVERKDTNYCRIRSEDNFGNQRVVRNNTERKSRMQTKRR